MKVKEASKRIGISRRTLQYYDDIHLVKANRIENNHRDYDDEQLEDIWRVMVLKEMGFELEEIRSLIHSDNINEVLKHKKNDIHKQISTLMEKMDFITYMGEVPISPYTTPMATSAAAGLIGEFIDVAASFFTHHRHAAGAGVNHGLGFESGVKRIFCVGKEIFRQTVLELRHHHLGAGFKRAVCCFLRFARRHRVRSRLHESSRT